MKLNLAQIQDPVLRENFRLLQDFLRSSSQFAGFKPFSFTLSSATPSGQNYILAHGLGYTPQDLVVTQSVGSGVVTYLYAKFDANFIYLTSTGAVAVRGLVGTFQKDPGI